jgi:TetR/AcrR family transcriptional regulator, mexCD-oprJ operon repressor
MTPAHAATGSAKPASRRADARQNRESIIEAAVACLGRNPDTSVAEIAAEAGVGRVTLYGHFATRTELVDAAMTRSLEHGETALAGVDLSGDPAQTLCRLIESSWELINRSRALLLAAQKVLPPGRIRTLHAKPEARILDLITRGQESGTFRVDLPASWLVSTLHSVMHGAANEVNAGRLDHANAAGYIAATVAPAFAVQASGMTAQPTHRPTHEDPR